MSAVGSVLGGLVSAVTSPIASVFGSAASAGANLAGTESQNQTALQIQQQQEQYNTEMADTTFQRTTKDLEAADLNPLLAVGSQDPSPTAPGAPVVNELGSAMNAGISTFSALQGAAQTAASTDNTKAQTNLNNVLSAKAAADTTSALASARVSNANANKIESGSLMSDIVGSDAAAKTSQFLNSAMDNVTDKIGSLIRNTHVNSAAASDRSDDWLSQLNAAGARARATGYDGSTTGSP